MNMIRDPILINVDRKDIHILTIALKLYKDGFRVKGQPLTMEDLKKLERIFTGAYVESYIEKEPQSFMSKVHTWLDSILKNEKR